MFALTRHGIMREKRLWAEVEHVMPKNDEILTAEDGVKFRVLRIMGRTVSMSMTFCRLRRTEYTGIKARQFCAVGESVS